MPGLYIPVAGETLTAANAISYWSKQVVIQATSGTRPSSPVEGMVIYQTDDDRMLVYNGAAWVTITPVDAYVATAQTTTSTSYTDLATAGPAVTVQLGTKASVVVSGRIGQTNANQAAYMSFAVSSATTLAAADDYSAIVVAAGATWYGKLSALTYLSALTAGSNVFTAKYKASANTADFQYRTIEVVGIP